MPPKISLKELIMKTGGEYHHYDQMKYIKRNGWDHPDYSHRHGASTTNTFNLVEKTMKYGLGEGVCLGLSAAYLIAGNNWRKFRDFIRSQEGKAYVRGIMNLQIEMSRTKRVADNQVNMAFIEFVRIYKVHFIKETRIPNPNLSKHIGDDILKNVFPQLGYKIRFFGPWGGHAVAMRIESGRIRFFDPNIGEVSYPYWQRSSPGMSYFLEHLLNEYYAPVQFMHIERYTLN